MDRTGRRIGRRPCIAAAVLLGGVAAIGTVSAILPDGRAARIERIAACAAPAATPKIEHLADGRKAVRLRVLLWNIEGLPWPIRSGRGPKLARIADWIARRRAAGDGPDILFLHKAFVPAASRVAAAGGFRSIVPGPALDQKRALSAAAPPTDYAAASHWWKGERIGKWLDSGLYVATDLPVIAARRDAFGADSCGGYDCLANKGGLMLQIAIPGAPEPLYLFNTHRNSREPAGVPIARAETAHVLQTRENDALLAASAPPGAAMIAAGDFNNYRAGDKSGRFADDPMFRLAGKAADYRARAAPMTDTAAWREAYDLVGYRGSAALHIEPLAVATLFDGKHGPRLADHDAQYIVFRVSWRAEAAATPVPACLR
jgi:hypothetical protein